VPRRTAQPRATQRADLDAVDLSLLDMLAVPASLHDAEGRCLHLNPAAELATGHTNAQVRGRPARELWPPEAYEQIRAAFASAADGEPADFETFLIGGDGHPIAARTQLLPLRVGAEIVGVIAFAFDVRLESLELPPTEPPPKLTPRQQEILTFVAGGLSTQEIAERLTLSSETVTNHLRSIYGLLHAHSRLEAVLAAERSGLLSPRPLGAARGRRETPGLRHD
jgi:PAS domain S-box-containing protein